MSFEKACGWLRFHKSALAAAACVAATCVGVAAGPAFAAEKITYLLPAPPSLPALAPCEPAQDPGYYSEAGYDVDFVVARGGVDVAKQMGFRSALTRDSIGQPAIIVRGNGVPVKA